MSGAILRLLSQFFLFALVSSSHGTQSKNILKFQSSSQDLSVFLISLGNGIKLATLLNCSVLLPAEIILRSHSLSSIPIVDIFDISKLRSQILTQFAVDLILDSEILDHRLHLSHPILKYTSLNQVTADLQRYLTATNIILDVGELFLRIIDTNCEAQKGMAKILHLILSSFPDSFRHSMSEILPILGDSYLSLDPGKTTSIDWNSISRPSFLGAIHVACANCSLPSLPWKDAHIVSISTLQKRSRSPASVWQDLSDVTLAIESREFLGVSSSTFSHLVVSERLYQNSSSVNLCLDLLPAPAPFTRDHHSTFGRTSPDVTCSHLKQINSSYHKAALQKIIHGIPRVFHTIGLEQTPFNIMMHLLSFEPSSHAIPLACSYLKVPQDDLQQIFQKINSLFRIPFQQDLVRSAVMRAMVDSQGQGGVPEGSLPPLRILMVIHNSYLQGAPLMAYYLAKTYQQRLGVKVDFFVNERQRGELETLITSQGMSVTAGSNLSSINSTAYDLIYLNTIATWYHEDLPHVLQLYADKCVMYVHESLREEVFKQYPSSREVMTQSRGLIFVTSLSMSVYKDILQQRQAVAKEKPDHYVIGNSLSPEMILQSQIDSERFEIRSKLGLSPTDILFVTSGDVFWMRNQRLLVDAARLLHEQVEAPLKVYFMIIGFTTPDAYVGGVYRRAERSKYPKQFIFKDKMPHEESLVYMAAGDVYISLAMKEAFGLTLLEAMTMGLPVIVAKLDGVPDVIYQEALDVKLRSVQSVTDAMKQMLSPATRRAHSALSQARSRDFQEHFFFLRHLQALTRLIDRN
jgi:glycosyltransferase involved in cell wall biosynthesis